MISFHNEHTALRGTTWMRCGYITGDIVATAWKWRCSGDPSIRDENGQWGYSSSVIVICTRLNQDMLSIPRRIYRLAALSFLDHSQGNWYQGSFASTSRSDSYVLPKHEGYADCYPHHGWVILVKSMNQGNHTEPPSLHTRNLRKSCHHNQCQEFFEDCLMPLFSAIISSCHIRKVV